jgi:hypothetical protein
MIPKTGFSFKSKRNWAGFFCPEARSECEVEWISEKEIFGFWLESVTAKAAGGESVESMNAVIPYALPF